ncbi:helix-turn-helix domain-containing protein [Actinoplanes philippinensis]
MPHTFLTVYRTGTMTRAAETPGLSRRTAIGRLRGPQTRFGRPLSVRRARGVTPAAAEVRAALRGAARNR